MSAGTMDVSLDQKTTTTATKERAALQWATNSGESGIGDLKSVAGHQAEQADSMLPIKAMKYSANTIAASVTSMSFTPESLGIKTNALPIPSEKRDLVRWRHTKSMMVSQTRKR